MTKREREITDEKELQDLLEGCLYLHLGLVDDGKPYIVPMNYGVDVIALYFICIAHMLDENWISSVKILFAVSQWNGLLSHLPEESHANMEWRMSA